MPLDNTYEGTQSGDYTIYVYRINEEGMKFEVSVVIAMDGDKPLYMHGNPDSFDPELTPELDLAKVLFSGFINSDCQLEITFDEPLVKFQSKEEVKALGNVLGRIYEIAANLIRNWKGDH